MKIVDKDYVVEIYPFKGNTFNNISVYKPQDSILGGEPTVKPATISWGSIGEVTPREAKEYAQGILKASELAKGLNDA